MSAQPEDHQMEGVEQPTVADKGKGKATEIPEESAEEESSDESGAEGEGAEDVDEDTMAEIDTSNIVGKRTRGKNIDFAKAAEELPEDEDEDEDEDFNDPDDEMKD
ncbi:hypothetical protein K458DRAFT_428199 [Lentithecium fluviatile CBS 122367]|uniref:Histone chaperone domain-containing protein n=1 Tax=Lentithecium fluviatile CBS 122367 TaxID=1168545 RepID=A0A6G1JEV6_9PLEO|nr:hypothetical protein K458DRAFT_428199 [Lentithecium fluviatile CBS 122367]